MSRPSYMTPRTSVSMVHARTLGTPCDRTAAAWAITWSLDV